MVDDVAERVPIVFRCPGSSAVAMPCARLRVIHHYAKQCASCDAQGELRKYWCGYVEVADHGNHARIPGVNDVEWSPTSVFLLNKSLGLVRTGLRSYAPRASFEAQTAILQAMEPDITLESMRVNLESADQAPILALRVTMRPIKACAQELRCQGSWQTPHKGMRR